MPGQPPNSSDRVGSFVRNHQCNDRAYVKNGVDIYQGLSQQHM